mmetsp:Transcript_20113/g.33878  ORF Transcript_20113/g.33878 Transcript_20113/m.33878 type:complete len:107 (-) Transcript_20113:1735-2055(-)
MTVSYLNQTHSFDRVCLSANNVIILTLPHRKRYVQIYMYYTSNSQFFARKVTSVTFLVLVDRIEGFLPLGGTQQEANELFRLSCKLFSNGSIMELVLAAVKLSAAA